MCGTIHLGVCLWGKQHGSCCQVLVRNISISLLSHRVIYWIYLKIGKDYLNDNIVIHNCCILYIPSIINGYMSIPGMPYYFSSHTSHKRLPIPVHTNCFSNKFLVLSKIIVFIFFSLITNNYVKKQEDYFQALQK